MTLKQRVAELLPHFDDDGKLLPNKIIYARLHSKDWAKSEHYDFLEMAESIKKYGAEYRIEDTPKRPREVWLSGDGKIVCACKTELAPFRFIEDTPRQVTDEDAKRIWEIISKNGSVIGLENVKLALQHYEQSRSK